MGGGSHIKMARELVIQMDKALGMHCQLPKGVLDVEEGGTFVSQRE